MVNVPRGVKFIALAWAVFLPYLVWFFGHLDFGILPPAKVIAAVFFPYVLVGGDAVKVIWGRISSELPAEDPRTVNYVPWVVGLAVCVIGVFAIESALGEAWKDHSAKAYIDRNLPVILASRSKEELLKRATFDLRVSQNVSESLRALDRLGRFITYQGTEGQVNVSRGPYDNHILIGSYRAHARFENGIADIAIQLMRDDEDWQIASFTVSSAGHSD